MRCILIHGLVNEKNGYQMDSKMIFFIRIFKRKLVYWNVIFWRNLQVHGKTNFSKDLRFKMSTTRWILLYKSSCYFNFRKGQFYTPWTLRVGPFLQFQTNSLATTKIGSWKLFKDTFICTNNNKGEIKNLFSPKSPTKKNLQSKKGLKKNFFV